MIHIGDYFINNFSNLLEALSKNLEHDMLISIFIAVIFVIIMIINIFIGEKRRRKYESKRLKK